MIFLKLLYSDFIEYRSQFSDSNGVYKFEEINSEISSKLKSQEHTYSAVSDIFEGLSNGNIIGGYGHGTDYWDKGKYTIVNEAFAHMFEAQFDKKRYAAMEYFFSNALKYFEKKLEDKLNEN